jgi:hypothetical protein
LIIEPSYQQRGLDGARKDLYIQRLRELGRNITLWPHIDEQLSFTKSVQIQMLDEIASHATFTHRPRTIEVTADTLLNDIAGMVLKREGGANSELVWLPGDSRYPSSQPKLAAILKDAGPYKLLAQEYVEYLQRVGEWRVYFCGGRVIFTIQTEPSGKGKFVFFSWHPTCMTLKGMWCV